MAASVYATPPPDFSGEEAAMSDTSNSSQTNSSNNSTMKATKRSLSSAFLNSPQTINTATQLSSDSIPDLSKKRRKQPMPSRISANGTEENVTLAEGNPEVVDDSEEAEANAIESIANAFAEQQSNFQKIFLSNLSQLQKQHLLRQQLEDHVEESANEEPVHNGSNPIISLKSRESLFDLPIIAKDSDDVKDVCQTICDDKPDEHCKDQNENESKNHSFDNGSTNNNDTSMQSEDKHDVEPDDSSKITDNVQNGDRVRDVSEFNLKSELLQDPEWDGEIRSTSTANLSKPEDWLSLPGLPFPFSPEAAAALSASGYMPQLPLLGMPSASSFGSSNDSNRPNVPPLRIFNPEAFCGLCNKEFCNKYFLKTHKANKHGIYEPQSGNSDSLPNVGPFNPLHQLSQVFQLQQQQQQQQQQQALQEQQDKAMLSQTINSEGPTSQQSQMRPTVSPKLPMNSIQPTVFCDICFKKFSSLSAMRKHRSKAHDPAGNNQQQQQHHGSDTGSKPPSPTSNAERLNFNSMQFRFPEGFREDYSIEQEDASFTPQPRKLSPLSIQAAREANFSVDKLKRLGVVNPEAFCEICCKEYCNKYFLRTHKLKRHGIFLPPDEVKEERSPWSFVQTSPLNLIVSGAENLGHPPPLKKLNDREESEQLMKSTALKEELLKNTDTKAEEDAQGEDVDDKDGPVDQDGEPISVDLQKLQSMIMQLSDLNNQRKMSCGICGKEVDNQYLLHTHMIQEHNNMNENNNGLKSPATATPMPASPNDFEVCKQCDKEFSNAFMLKQHLMEVHGSQNVSPKREGFITPDRPTATSSMGMPTGPNYGERKPTFSMTPTSSYCEICNKELCNKYFMKTHMQRMHGIEIENGAQIGGVVCNICNKELCSKYFLRVHKHNTHGIVEEGAPLPQPRNNGESAENSEPPFPVDSVLKPGEITDVSNRYYSHFTEVCPLCSRRFRSAKWLRAHLLSDHGKMGVDKLREIEHKLGSGSKSSSPSLKIPNGGMNVSTSEPKFNPKIAFGFNSPDAKFLMKNPFSGLFGADPSNSNLGPKGYQCSYCPFATPLLPLLFIHERTHTSLSIVQQQLLQEEEKHQMQLPPLHLSAIKSESAVSLAKEKESFMLPTSVPTSETPSLTPASTPVPSMSQEAMTIPTSSVLQQDTPMQQSPSRKSPNARESPKSTSPRSEQNGILSEMANLTQRPAVYALPQQAGPLLMQSFLIEESSSAASSKDGAEEQGTSLAANRFVPAVVFLPVKERILSPMTISFTLSPA
ncbi:uncharacterized protein LOC5573579 [Aedes aegypti]|uniref:Uncharacterized protein n=1 Tax=Aedes aegypti TaxID=7159 RepID=A0A1S4F0P7_AEDAE|nr:uncharacterized protein LOC5573579 [Aedes aegypti]